MKRQTSKTTKARGYDFYIEIPKGRRLPLLPIPDKYNEFWVEAFKSDDKVYFFNGETYQYWEVSAILSHDLKYYGARVKIEDTEIIEANYNHLYHLVYPFQVDPINLKEEGTHFILNNWDKSMIEKLEKLGATCINKGTYSHAIFKWNIPVSF
jgi:hypothetical protein